jgi:hypothetical protein
VKPTGPVILGAPAGLLSHLAGLPPWLVIVVVAASLTLGLVQAIVPQDSADRLRLLLALRRPRPAPAISPATTVAGHAEDTQDPGAPQHKPSAQPQAS